MKIAAKGGEGGKLFGAITGKEIAAALAEQFSLTIDGKKDVYKRQVVEIPRRRYAGGGLLRQRVRRPEAPYFLQQPCVHALVL